MEFLKTTPDQNHPGFGAPIVHKRGSSVDPHPQSRIPSSGFPPGPKSGMEVLTEVENWV